MEDYIISLRREFHRYGESGWTEFRTTARIVEELQRAGIGVRWGREIHAPEKMYGLPSPAALEACFDRALAEMGRPDLLEPMRGGFTGCAAEIRGAKPGKTIAIRVDIDCCEVQVAPARSATPAASAYAPSALTRPTMEA